MVKCSILVCLKIVRESYLSENRNHLIKKGLPPKRILSYNGEETMVFETTNNFAVKIKQRRRNDYEGTILSILDGKERTVKLIETFQIEGLIQLITLYF